MDDQLYLVIFRKGMTGGTPKGIYKMLSSSENWEYHLAYGTVDFYAANILVCTFNWTTVEASSEEEAIACFDKEAISKEGYEVVAISYNEAQKIDKGESQADDYSGSVSQEVIDLIIANSKESDIIKIKREHLDKSNKDKKQE